MDLHSPPPPPQVAQAASAADRQNDDEIDLVGLVNVLLDARWFIVAITVLALLVGGAYAFLSRPTYQANALIQVEDSQPNAGRILGEASSLFDIKSPTAGEMGILRSRLVVGEAVAVMRLYIRATPRYIPLIGNWLARHASGLSNPGFLGIGGYVSGTESIYVRQLEVPADLKGKPLLLVATPGGFALHAPDGSILVQGKVGTPVDFGDGNGRILVTELHAKPGAWFTVQRDSRERVVQDLQKRLNISEQGRESGIIDVTLQGSDPREIARTLNVVGTSYVRQNTERKAAQAEKSLAFLDDYLPKLKTQLEESEARFNAFRDKNGAFDLGEQGKNYLDTIVKLQANLLELQQKRRAQSVLFAPANPVIQTLDAQIAAVDKDIAAMTAKVKTLPNTEQGLLRLQRDVKVNSTLYLDLLTSAQQLRLVKEGKVGNVRMVDTPVVPERPVKPERALVLAISGVLGLFLGMGLALVRSSLRPGIADPADIESAIGLHVFATIPHSPAQTRLSRLAQRGEPGLHLLATSAPDDPGVEGLRSLRTALQFAMLDARNNIVLFTGPTPGMGKSFASANFAAVLGAGGKRVLLIDADLRRGHVHQLFGQPRGHGLSELVTGSVPLPDVLRRAVAPNLDLIATGTLPPNPSELLSSPAAVRLLQVLAAQYDIVIVDSPPVLAVSDTQVLAPQAGTVMLLARAEVTSLAELHESTRRLAHAGARVKGVVFNGLDISRKRYGSKYSSYRYTDYNYRNTGSSQ